VWFDRQGAVTPLPTPPAFYGLPRLSPDGSRVAVSMSDPDSNIWVFDAAKGTRTQITSDGKSLWPIWTRDGAGVVYTSMRGGPALLRARNANGTGEETIVLENELINRAQSWTPNGDLVVMQVRATADLWVVPPGAPPRPYVVSRANEDSARVSPDGQWLAYRVTASGTSEIFVGRITDNSGDRDQVSRNGGALVAWSHDGRELVYRNGNEILAVNVSAAGVFGEPRRLFTSSLQINDGPEVAPDGRLLMLVEEQPAPAPTEYYLTLNIGAEIRRRAASQ
jgi:Tol biopolymer transport system component